MPALPLLDIERWQILYLAMRCRLGGQAFRLLITMLRHVDPPSWEAKGTLVAWPSTREIELEAGLSSSSIWFAREELLAAGLLSKAPGHQQGGCDPIAIYKINRRVASTAEARATAKARRARQQSRTQQKLAQERQRLAALNGQAPVGGSL
jgi:hypothetical protein